MRGSLRWRTVAANASILVLLSLLVGVEAVRGALPDRPPPEAAVTSLLATTPALASDLRRLVGGSPTAAVEVHRWLAAPSFFVHGDATPSDLVALDAALRELGAATGLSLARGDRDARVQIYLVDRDDFVAYDQAPLGAEQHAVARTFDAASGALERGRIVLDRDLPEAERARLMPRLIAHVLGLRTLPLEGGALTSAEQAVLRFLYRSDVSPGSRVPVAP